jgi:hypothetical protein
MSRLVYRDERVDLWAEGLDDSEADCLTLQAICRRCGRRITARTYRLADYPTVEAVTAAALGEHGARDTQAVLAHTAQCGRRANGLQVCMG